MFTLYFKRFLNIYNINGEYFKRVKTLFEFVSKFYSTDLHMQIDVPRNITTITQEYEKIIEYSTLRIRNANLQLEMH
jgi:hypothetical protein